MYYPVLKTYGENNTQPKNMGIISNIILPDYGLKQAPKAWYGKIVEFLNHSGYLVTSADASLFVKAKG